jgi:hypothetical protein
LLAGNVYVCITRVLYLRLLPSNQFVCHSISSFLLIPKFLSLTSSVSYFLVFSGEIVFSLPAPAAAAVAGETAAEPTVTITLGMTKTDGLTATVTLTSDSSVLATVNIPSAKTSQ